MLDKKWESYKDVPATFSSAPEMFLDYFYPIHYSIGMRVEAGLMASGKLDRHQTVIMWILRSEAQRTGSSLINRKEIVRLMTNWYDITSSSVSKALRGLSKPPLNFIRMTEDPNSGREKVIEMTAEGRKHCEDMIQGACQQIKRITDNMTLDENKMGVYMFMRMDVEFSKNNPDD